MPRLGSHGLFYSELYYLRAGYFYTIVCPSGLMTPIEHTFSARKQSYQLVVNRSSASSLCLLSCNHLRLFIRNLMSFILRKRKVTQFQSPEGNSPIQQVSKVATEMYLAVIATQLIFWIGVSWQKVFAQSQKSWSTSCWTRRVKYPVNLSATFIQFRKNQ